jgi:hypothetical protein
MGFTYIMQKNQPPIIKEVPKLDSLRIRDTIVKPPEISFSDLEIDFKKLDAFSIERALQDNHPVTLICFKDKDNEVKEFYLYCTEERHVQLVKKFRRQISN